MKTATKKRVSGRWALGSETVRVNWTLRRRAKLIAEGAGEGPGTSVSSYVSSVLEQRFDEMTSALEYLGKAGWAKKEIRDAIEDGSRGLTAVSTLRREWLAGNATLRRMLS